MNKSRKAAYLSIGIGLLVLVTTSTSLPRFAIAQENTPASDSHSSDGVSKKDLKELSNCQSKAGKDGQLTETELDSCYANTFPGSEPASNTTPQQQPASEPGVNSIPFSGPNQISPMNSSGSNDLPIDKATISEIIKNRFGLGP
ncbi:MAG TPA: hypothetical protein VH796_05845 [Nitrososphaeraceae archaeon]|jgi:hypothetical protein